ncbi:hypothetical protein [Caudoviricetes sp.]|nr:hypothetical protein [Caudoviricetes sp.]
MAINNVFGQRLQPAALPSYLTEENQQQQQAIANRYQYQKAIEDAETRKNQAQLETIRKSPTTADAVAGAVQGLKQGVQDYQTYKHQAAQTRAAEAQATSAEFANKMNDLYGERQARSAAELSEGQAARMATENKYLPERLRAETELAQTQSKYAEPLAKASLKMNEAQATLAEMQQKTTTLQQEGQRLQNETAALQNKFEQETQLVRKQQLAAQVYATKAQAQAALQSAAASAAQVSVARENLAMAKETFARAKADDDFVKATDYASTLLAQNKNPKEVADALVNTFKMSPDRALVATQKGAGANASAKQTNLMFQKTMQQQDPAYLQRVNAATIGSQKAQEFAPIIAMLQDVNKAKEGYGVLSVGSNQDFKVYKNQLDSIFTKYQDDPKIGGMAKEWANKTYINDNDIANFTSRLQKAITDELNPYLWAIKEDPEFKTQAEYVNNIISNGKFAKIDGNAISNAFGSFRPQTQQNAVMPPTRPALINPFPYQQNNPQYQPPAEENLMLPLQQAQQRAKQYMQNRPQPNKISKQK